MTESTNPPLRVRTAERKVEVGWFSALCSDDYEFLTVPDGRLRSSFEHCSNIVRRADELGYQNILLPSSWQVGQEPIPFAAAMGQLTRQINQLIAVRMGEIHPPMLARHISTLDHMLKGRLTINIISSDLPGESLGSVERYARSGEVIQILKQCWNEESVHFRGEFYQLDIDSTLAARSYQQNGGPLLYFGGISDPAVDLCAKHCDVYLMWPETTSRLSETMQKVSEKAAKVGRSVDFGLRIHVIVRETEAEAQAAADRLVSQMDIQRAHEIKARAQDHQSAGVMRQDALRDESTGDYIESQIWSGIGRARSGCGSAIVGDPDQVYAKLQTYVDMGMRAFILSGYPHLDECDLFARYVLPRLETAKLNELQGRKIADPVTPLTTAPRV